VFALCNVSRRHGSVIALDALTLQFATGTVTAVIGSSGAGKSSLLRVLLGLEWPDSGEVRVDGAVLSRATRLAARRRIGYVIQQGGLFPHLSVRGNLALLPRRLGWTRRRIEERACELAALMQLPGTLLERYPAELSGGQRQRVAVMRALMTDPPALLLDEPLGALDPLVRMELQERLHSLFHELCKTVVLVTHDLAEAAYLASRLVLMRAGRVVQDGAAEDLVMRPADEFVRRFVAAQGCAALPADRLTCCPVRCSACRASRY
jgi:osmoprotectant transport system ATP-binding protein